MKYSEFIKLVLKEYRERPNYLCLLAKLMGARHGLEHYSVELQAQIMLEIQLASERAGLLAEFSMPVSTVLDMFSITGFYEGPNKPLYYISLARHCNQEKAARITMLLHLYKAALKQELHHGA